MTDMGTEITLPTGRIVWGHPINQQFKTDQQTNKPVLNDQGQKIPQWSFGIAIPRADFEQHVWPAMFAEASKGYPGGATPPHFSWKYKDGDTGIDREGKPYRDREGYAGCIVLTCSTELQAPGVFKLENGVYRQMQPEEIKTGDYARVGVNFKVNVPKQANHTPGLYVNPLAVEFVGYGTEIKGSYQVDPNAMFGGQAAPLPPGASATPIAAAPPAQMPGMGMQPPPPAMQPAPPPPVQAGRPTDPTHIHNNGNGTEQWLVNGAWDGQAHPIPQAPALPPPATGFVAQAAGMPAPGPGGVPAMPGMPAPR